jgi:hypothetical protein
MISRWDLVVYPLSHGDEATYKNIYPTEAAARAALDQAVAWYREDAYYGDIWDPDIERICMGRVTHRVHLLPVCEEMTYPGEDEYCEAFVRAVDSSQGGDSDGSSMPWPAR